MAIRIVGQRQRGALERGANGGQLPAAAFACLLAGGCGGSGAAQAGVSGENGPGMGTGGTSSANGTGRVCQVQPSTRGLRIVTTQAELDELTGCEEILGPLRVDAPDRVLLDLRPLSSLLRVDGPLTIGCNPYLGTDSYCGESVERSFTLEGLENLESAASLTLGGLRVSSLAALRSLRDIGQELNIVNCNALENLDGLRAPVSTFSFQSNALLASLVGLTVVPAAERVHIQGAPALTDLSALAPLTSVGQLELREMPLQNLNDVRNLTSLRSLYLIDVPALNDVSALDQVRTLDELYLDGTALESLDALQLESIQALYLAHNPVLLDVDGLGNLARLGKLDVLSNDNLVRLPAFPNITQLTGVFLQFNAALSEGPSFPNLERMPSGTIAVADNPKLLRLNGFARLSEVAAIEIRENAQLVEVDFGRLTSAGRLHITCNPGLAGASLESLTQVSSPDRYLDGNLGSEELCPAL